MERTKKDLEDLTAELQGAAAILQIMAGGFLEDGGPQPTEATTGAALFGVGRYIERVAAEIDAFNDPN